MLNCRIQQLKNHFVGYLVLPQGGLSIQDLERGPRVLAFRDNMIVESFNRPKWSLENPWGLLALHCFWKSAGGFGADHLLML